MTVRKLHDDGHKSCGDIKPESLGLSSIEVSTLPVDFFVFYQVFAVFYQVFFHIPVRYMCFKSTRMLRERKRTPRIYYKGPGPGLGVLLPRQGLGLGYGSEGEG